MSAETKLAAAETKVVKSVCHGCHGGCSVLLHVDDGVLTRIEGDPEGPLNHGAICPMGTGAKDLVYHPDRLNYPMKRVGPRGSGQWERISWDEALDTIVAKVKAAIDEVGVHSVVMGTGTGRHHCRWVIRFANALGTPNWCEPGTAQCFIPRVETGMMTYGAFPVGDFSGHRPDTIMYWGHNPLNSGPDGETRFASKENYRAARQIIVVDPRENELSKHADVWLRLRPGTDDALALAMIHVIINEGIYDRDFVEKWTYGFEELKERVQQYSPEWAEPITWVKADDIRRAARLWAASPAGTLEWGCAIEHTPNTIQTVRAVALLPALCGQIDVPGGWVFGGAERGNFPMYNDRIDPEVAKKRLGYGKYRILTERGMPAAHIPTLINAILTGEPYPIKAFLVFGNNALTTYANTTQTREALEKIEFLVHCDHFMQPTAAYADIVLPAASWPEINTTHSAPFFSSYVFGTINQAVRLHERRSDEEILIELGKRLGLNMEDSVDEAIQNEVLSGPHGMSVEELRQRGSQIMPLTYRKHERDGRFRTRTGKVELYCTELEALGYDPLPYYEEPPESPYSQPEMAKTYPLVLTTGHRSPFFFHSEGRQLPRQRKAHKEPRCEIHPDTAAAAGINDGEWMWIENARGKIRQRAKFSAAIDPRVVAAEHGWWFPEKAGPDYGVYESNVNLLTNNQPPYDPAMGTYQLRGLLCRVRRFDEEALPVAAE